MTKTQRPSFIDVPAHRPWARQWIGRSVRLAVIGALVGSVTAAIAGFTKYQEELSQLADSRLSYECAARFDDALLLPSANEFGNVDIEKFGCSNRVFFVSLSELQSVRAGKMEFNPAIEPIDFERVTVWGLFSGGIILVVSFFLIGAVKTARWVWGG